MNVYEINLTNPRQVGLFLRLPFQIYAANQHWVPPLAMEARQVLDRRKNPFFKHGEAAFFLAEDPQGRILGRIAAAINHNYVAFNDSKTAFFYLFECVNDQHAADRLFDAAVAWARACGMQKIIGPKGFSVFDGTGLLVRGFEYRPAFGLPYNPPYYARMIERLGGFEPSLELVSGYMNANLEFPRKIHELSERIQKRRGLRVQNFKRRAELRQLVPVLKDLYNHALTGTSGNAPLTDDDVNTLADQMLWFADPKLIKLVMHGEDPVGFLFAYPDVSAALQRNRGRLFPLGWLQMFVELRTTRWINLNGAGMVEEYRGLGGTALLFSEMYKSVAGSRYRHADLVQIGTENDKMQRELRGFGIDFYKMHRLYEKVIA